MSPFPKVPPLGASSSLPWIRILADGHYRVVLTPSGAGFSTLDGLALTSGTEDPRRGEPSPPIFLREVANGSCLPMDGPKHPTRDLNLRAGWRPGVFQREGMMGVMESATEICVPPGRGMEIRRLNLRNRSHRPRRIEITTAIEVVLNDPAAHSAHPAFSKLFLETEMVPEERCLLVRRRPRVMGESHPWMFHALLGASVSGFETDRARFWGRGSSPGLPRALTSGEPLSGTSGSVLDPILSLRTVVDLGGGEETQIAFLIGAASDRSNALAGVRGAAAPQAIERGFAEARTRAEGELREIGLSGDEAEYLQALAGAAMGGRADLWAVFRADGSGGAALLPDMLKACRYWKALGLPKPVLIASGAPLSSDPEDDGYTLVRSHEVPPAILDRLVRGARVVVRDRFPDLIDRGVPEARAERPARHAPPKESRATVAPEATSAPPEEQLRFDNGYGGFSPDGTEYVIRVAHRDGRTAVPPRPWTNVVANDGFGFLLSETGAGTTWKGNSREHRLTPWYNDPLLDPHGEAFYVRDEESGDFWSVFPGPCPRTADYVIRHGLGYSVCRLTTSGLEFTTRVFVPRRDPLKVTVLEVVNRGARARRLSVFSYYRLVIGSSPEETGPYLATRFDPRSETVLAHNLSGDRRGLVFATMFASAPVLAFHFTGDRGGFLGAGGDLANPAGLRRHATLDGRTGRGLDPCIAEQVVLEIPPGSSSEITCLFGEEDEIGEVRALIARFREPRAVDRALEEIREFWNQGVAGVRIETPMPALDLLVNRWLPYQILSCRLWARSALYQSGGAFGYRDQLQDASALVYLWPERTRAQILLHAAHQFEEGDVLHWWHPPRSRGLRTRFADDSLWLPFVTADYVRITGDRGVLDQPVPFLRARALAPGEDEALLEPEASDQVADVYEHCCRTLDRSLTRGEHGLPLFGTGDWNDGMNRVGREGRGESVWMGFFLHAVLGGFLPLCRDRGDEARVRRYQTHREALRVAVNDAGWDGGWYRRGYFDDGSPLGSSTSEECRIDALAQAWAVLSEAAPGERGIRAMEAVEEHLVSETDGIIRLFTPPFDRSPRDPGYIRGYVPGVRENGGQYTHAALWVVGAVARLGWNNRAAALLQLLNPIRHTRDAEAVRVYGAEPYVVAADVYGEPPHVGRAGWTWYTGSAGWMYRIALESILGLEVRGGRLLVLDPCVPDAWPGFTLDYRIPGEETRYQIQARNPHGKARQVVGATLDGVSIPIEGGAAHVPLHHDGARHRVELILGEGGDRRS